ncbi:UNVERIFIED_CONTAM: hypothetical protein Sradi_6825300 [Sesamum radiatum]|uniref:DUF4218 domain-containing protein n=1 Tax=Sesamum radiatum TaxID=300843 RepID=A0AAW2JTD5_SESRA
MGEGLRFPDGYTSNIARCVDIANLRLHSMKSHDCHVFMQKLIPIAFRELLLEFVWGALVELSILFQVLCSTTLDVKKVQELEENVSIIMCNLEKIFPPAFFDSVEHLIIHLPYEALMGGPVQYRWMYPFERFLHDSKKKVKNKAHVEASICEAYIVQEIGWFTFHYIESHVTCKRYRSSRNDELSQNNDRVARDIFNHLGRKSGVSTKRYALGQERHVMETYVLCNSEVVAPYYQCLQDLLYSPWDVAGTWTWAAVRPPTPDVSDASEASTQQLVPPSAPPSVPPHHREHISGLDAVYRILSNTTTSAPSRARTYISGDKILHDRAFHTCFGGVVSGHYMHPWSSYKDIPDPQKNFWFEELKETYQNMLEECASQLMPPEEGGSSTVSVTFLEEEQLWNEATGGTKPGRVFGMEFEALTLDPARPWTKDHGASTFSTALPLEPPVSTQIQKIKVMLNILFDKMGIQIPRPDQPLAADAPTEESTQQQDEEAADL